MRTNSQLIQHLSTCQDCGKSYTALLDNRDSNNKILKIVPVHCKSHFCSDCRTFKTYELKRKLKYSMFGKDFYFLTLTLNSKIYDLRTAYKTINKFWNRFVIECKRKNFKFEYFKVIEFHKSGYPHIHAIIDKFIPHQLIKTLWNRISNSWIVDIQKARTTNGVAYYLLKYLNKVSNFEHLTLYYTWQIKRFTASKNFFVKHSKLKFWKWCGLNFNSIEEAIKKGMEIFGANELFSTFEFTTSLELPSNTS